MFLQIIIRQTLYKSKSYIYPNTNLGFAFVFLTTSPLLSSIKLAIMDIYLSFNSNR